MGGCVGRGFPRGAYSVCTKAAIGGGNSPDSSPRGSCSTAGEERLEPQLGTQPRCKITHSGKCVFVAVGTELLLACGSEALRRGRSAAPV